VTTLKTFSIAANGAPMGFYKGVDEDDAVLAYAMEAGYRTIVDAAFIHSEYGLSGKTAEQLEQIVSDWREELEVEEVLAAA